jgi:L-threonylcarbamoyladenylate synthase
VLPVVGNTAFLARLRGHFRRGGLIAYPTESCYGLGCDPRNARAVRHLIRLKGRPQHKGLILIADRYARLQPYLAPLTTLQQQSIFPTWPGPHTWLMPVARKTPRWLRGEFATLAVRITAHPGAAALCRALGSALVSTSANRAGLKPLKTYAACVKAFGNEVLVVPGRIGKRKKPSTIQDLTSGKLVRG